MFYKCRVNLDIQLHAHVCMRGIEEVLFYNTERKKKKLGEKERTRKTKWLLSFSTKLV